MAWLRTAAREGDETRPRLPTEAHGSWPTLTSVALSRTLSAPAVQYRLCVVACAVAGLALGLLCVSPGSRYKTINIAECPGPLA